MTRHRRHRDRRAGRPRPASPPSAERPVRLEVVLKADSSGTLEAARKAVLGLQTAVEVAILHAGVGPVNKTDLLTATTGSHLVLGFGAETVARLDEMARQAGVEVRLYTVIYRLLADLKAICAALSPPAPNTWESVTGTARVIALFKGPRKGIIIGCQVIDGELRLHDRFRLINAMGPVYRGHIASLQMERKAISRGRPGQQVAIKLRDFNRVAIGDLVECYTQAGHEKRPARWRPQPGVKSRC